MRFEINFEQIIFKQNLAIDGRSISCEIVLRWMSVEFTDDKSTLVQVMACRRQQAITWAMIDPDLCRPMVSLDHNYLINVWVPGVILQILHVTEKLPMAQIIAEQYLKGRFCITESKFCKKKKINVEFVHDT